MRFLRNSYYRRLLGLSSVTLCLALSLKRVRLDHIFSTWHKELWTSQQVYRYQIPKRAF